MAVPVMIGLLVGVVVGGAVMALWAASRIGEEGARQFDRGFERGRWLADLSVARALEPPPPRRTPRARVVALGDDPATTSAPPSTPSLLLRPLKR